MNVESISKTVVFVMRTDDDELFNYTRYSADNWFVTMGESDEHVYDSEELEELFQKNKQLIK
ncbi:MAG: hypothetical protein GY941_22465 [Planctomycetes bacterium]|nr:hypothetical protein [Planctomycetota bacterium]